MATPRNTPQQKKTIDWMNKVAAGNLRPNAPVTTTPRSALPPVKNRPYLGPKPQPKPPKPDTSKTLFKKVEVNRTYPIKPAPQPVKKPKPKPQPVKPVLKKPVTGKKVT